MSIPADDLRAKYELLVDKHWPGYSAEATIRDISSGCLYSITLHPKMNDENFKHPTDEVMHIGESTESFWGAVQDLHAHCRGMPPLPETDPIA